MRIVQAVGWYFPDSLGGTEVYVAGLSARLQAAGYDVLIAAPYTADREERRYYHDGVAVYRYPISPTPTRQECQGQIPVRGTELFHACLANYRPDVVHLHTFVTGLGLDQVRAAKLLGARVVVTNHSARLGFICQRGTMMRWGRRLCDGLMEPWKCVACALHERGLPKLVAGFLAAIPPGPARVTERLPGRWGTLFGMPNVIARNRRMQRELLDATDAFVVLTGWAFRAIVANGGPSEKVRLNRLGVSATGIARKPERPTSLPLRVGYLGRFEDVKGVHILARAFASIERQVPIHIEFRGPASTVNEQRVVAGLKKLLAGDPRATFAPAVPIQDAGAVLARYDILCCPAICLEGGPTVALEAQAVGTPVVGSDIGGLRELVTDGVNGRLVAPGDWHALARALRGIVEHPDGTVDRWRQALGRPRTMDQVADEYLALYADSGVAYPAP